ARVDVTASALGSSACLLSGPAKPCRASASWCLHIVEASDGRLMADLVVLETGAGPSTRTRYSFSSLVIVQTSGSLCSGFGDVILFFIHIIRLGRDSRQPRLREVCDSSWLDSCYFPPPSVSTKEVGANCERFLWTSRLQ